MSRGTAQFRFSAQLREENKRFTFVILDWMQASIGSNYVRLMSQYL